MAAEAGGREVAKKVIKAKTVRNVFRKASHIMAMFNNTVVLITDLKGKVIGWSSAGRVGFKGSCKSTANAANWWRRMPARRQGMVDGLKEIEVGVKGLRLFGEKPEIRALQAIGGGSWRPPQVIKKAYGPRGHNHVLSSHPLRGIIAASSSRRFRLPGWHEKAPRRNPSNSACRHLRNSPISASALRSHLRMLQITWCGTVRRSPVQAERLRRGWRSNCATSTGSTSGIPQSKAR